MGQPPLVGVHIGKARFGSSGRLFVVEDPHQPTAIVQRFISSPGQNISFAHSVPSKTPRAFSASMLGLCTPSATSENPPGGSVFWAS